MKKLMIMTIVVFALFIALFVLLFKNFTYGGYENIKTPTRNEVLGVYKNHSLSAVRESWKKSKPAAVKMREAEYEKEKAKLPPDLTEKEYEKKIKLKSRSRYRMKVILDENEFLDNSDRFTVQAFVIVTIAIIVILVVSAFSYRKNIVKDISFDNIGVTFKNKE